MKTKNPWTTQQINSLPNFLRKIIRDTHKGVQEGYKEACGDGITELQYYVFRQLLNKVTEWDGTYPYEYGENR